MKTRNVAFRLSVLATVILTGMIFCSVSFADYGTVIQGSLCGSGSNSGGVSEDYSGPGYDDDTGGDTWAGYDHHVGLKYMKIGDKTSGNWDGSVTWALNEIPDKKDFRIKLKQKGGVN